MTDHAKLLELAKGATPGPWEHHGFNLRGSKPNTCVVSSEGEAELGTWYVAQTQWVPDAAYIAAANPEIIIALITENAALQARVDGAFNEGVEAAAKIHEDMVGHWEDDRRDMLTLGEYDKSIQCERNAGQHLLYAKTIRTLMRPTKPTDAKDESHE